MQLHTEPKLPANRRAQRELVHDLRNLFGVVASAKRMLERDPNEAKRIFILDALEDAATRGGLLTTGLLSDNPDASVATIDIHARLLELSAMIRAMAGVRIAIDFQPGNAAALARLVPSDFDAAILELVANAAAADASRIAVRLCVVRARVWIVIGDDGQGMTSSLLEQARSGFDAGRAHGAGICRVRQFVRAAHGHFLVRSRPGVGTAICMNLPMVLKLAVREPGALEGRVSLSA